jgi:hypothetical protein
VAFSGETFWPLSINVFKRSSVVSFFLSFILFYSLFILLYHFLRSLFVFARDISTSVKCSILERDTLRYKNTSICTTVCGEQRAAGAQFATAVSLDPFPMREPINVHFFFNHFREASQTNLDQIEICAPVVIC